MLVGPWRRVQERACEEEEIKNTQKGIVVRRYVLGNRAGSSGTGPRGRQEARCWGWG